MMKTLIRRVTVIAAIVACAALMATSLPADAGPTLKRVPNPELTTRLPPNRILSFGDSFASGQSVGDYEPGTDAIGTEAGSNTCHRSENAFGPRINDALNQRLVTSINLARPITRPRPRWYPLEDFVACSGATADNITYLDQFPDPLPGSGSAPSLQQFAQLDMVDPIKAGGFGIATVTIGTNDLGYSSVLLDCGFTTPVAENCFDYPGHGNDLILNFDDYLPALEQELIDTYTAIRNHVEPATAFRPAGKMAVFVPSYMQLFADGAADEDCKDGDGVGLLTGTYINAAERAWMNDAALALNATIKAATEAVPGVFYVSLDEHFEGRRICDPNPAILSLNVGAGSDLFESAHPNRLGHDIALKVVVDAIDAAGY